MKGSSVSKTEHDLKGFIMYIAYDTLNKLCSTLTGNDTVHVANPVCE